MPGYIQNPYMPQYGGFQYGNYPMQPNSPYQTPTTYPTFNPQPQTISNSADALVKSDISGKIVDTENDISVNDIPMDGKVHLFILKDYSKVIGKAWTADGKIATSVYVLEQQSQPQTTTDNSREWLQKQFDEIKDILMDKATTPQIGK